jgi:hypothetical protein
MKGLNLHSGGNTVSLDELAFAPTPAHTNTYYPIPHIDLVEQVRDSLSRIGFAITAETHAVNKERYFGLMDIKSDYADRSTTIGLRNSHDQKFPIGFAVGNHVFVCSNLSFSGEITFKRRHTTYAQRDLPLLVDAAVGRISEFETSQDARFEAYKTTELSIQEVDHAMMSALRAQVIPGSTLPKILTEWEHPQHPEFAKDGRTLWRLFNAFTEHMKNSLWLLPKRTIALQAILDSFVPKMPLEYAEFSKDLFPV